MVVNVHLIFKNVDNFKKGCVLREKIEKLLKRNNIKFKLNFGSSRKKRKKYDNVIKAEMIFKIRVGFFI